MRKTIILAFLVATMALLGCRPAVLRSVNSADQQWRADLVAIRKPPLGTIDGKIIVYYRGKEAQAQTILTGRDEVQDVDNEVRTIEFESTNLVLYTKGTFGPQRIVLPLTAGK